MTRSAFSSRRLTGQLNLQITQGLAATRAHLQPLAYFLFHLSQGFLARRTGHSNGADILAGVFHRPGTRLFRNSADELHGPTFAICLVSSNSWSGINTFSTSAERVSPVLSVSIRASDDYRDDPNSVRLQCSPLRCRAAPPVGPTRRRAGGSSQSTSRAFNCKHLIVERGSHSAGPPVPPEKRRPRPTLRRTRDAPTGVVGRDGAAVARPFCSASGVNERLNTGMCIV